MTADVLTTKLRDPALDALRTLAVLGMMATHTTRLVQRDGRDAWNIWAMLFEPVIPALFLVLAGASLLLSWHSKKADSKIWWQRQLRRALGLWVIGVIFYFAESGFRLPDLIFSPGILATIAYAILLITPIMTWMSSVYATWLLTALLLMGCGAYQYLDSQTQKVFWLNAGNSPMLPLLLFALVGALAVLWGKKLGAAGRWALTLMAIGISGFCLWRYGAQDLFTKPLGRSDASRVFSVVKDGVTQNKVLGYYNLRPLLSIFVLSFFMVIWQVLCMLRPLLQKMNHFFFLMGRHSLAVYILHLSLLAIPFVLWGAHPFKHGWQGATVWLALLVICQLFSLLKERFSAKTTVGA